MSLKNSILSTAFAAALASSASAGLLYYEGFDYRQIAAPTELLADAFVLTTTEGWTTTNSLRFANPGLATGPFGIPSVGGALRFETNSTGLQTNWGPSGVPAAGTYWYSFIVRRNHANTQGTFVIFGQPGTNGQNGLGIRMNSGGTITAWSLNYGSGTSAYTWALDETITVVGKVVFASDASSTNQIWVNPTDVTSETTLGTTRTASVSTNAAGGATMSKFLSGRAFSGNTAPGYTVDEVRIGETLIDVTTPPAANQPPVIITEPQSTAKYVGQALSLSVGASGTSPIAYSWRKVTGVDPLVNFSEVGTSASFSIASVQLSDAGDYYCFVSNSFGDDTSATVTLTVTAPVGLSITTQPTNATVNAGVTASLTVVAEGNPAPTYQWQKNTGPDTETFTNVAGATSATLNIANTDFLAEGVYRCAVSYSVPGVSGSSTTTNTNTVTVTALIDPSEGDTDNDGMADSLEKYLRNLGFVVGVSNTAKVQSMINTGYNVSFTGTPTTSEVNELALTPTTITRLPSGEIELSFGLKEAATPTSTFTTKTLTTGDVSVSGGKIILSVGDGLGNTDFYRLSTETK